LKLEESHTFYETLILKYIVSMKKAAISIIILGLILTVFTAFHFFTKEKVVDIGEVHITRNKPHNISWSPLIGVAVMGIGSVVLLVSSNGKKIF
jgi:hypothetical protein